MNKKDKHGRATKKNSYNSDVLTTAWNQS